MSVFLGKQLAPAFENPRACGKGSHPTPSGGGAAHENCAAKFSCEQYLETQSGGGGIAFGYAEVRCARIEMAREARSCVRTQEPAARVLIPPPPEATRPARTAQRNFAASNTSKLKAEGVGFEPTVSFPTSVFKTDAIDHSATPPWVAVTHESVRQTISGARQKPHMTDSVGL